MTNELLKTSELSKHYNGVRAVEDISLSIGRGEVHALVGENGAGKSSLIKMLTGLVRPGKGGIVFEGRAVAFRKPDDAIRAGIVAVHQELTLVETMTVSENIWLGHEPRKRTGVIDYARMEAESYDLLKSLDIRIDVNDKVGDLSLADRQLVELMKALARQPKLLILDEATSTLGEQEVERLFAAVRKLTAAGKSVIYVSHRMKEIFQLCDRCTVLRDGRMVRSANVADIREEDLIEWMTGRKLSQHFPAKGRISPERPALLSVRGLCTASGVRNVDLDVRAGEIVGIGGLQGHGQVELIHALFGMESLTAGRVEVEGKPVRLRSPKDAVASGIQLVPQDRKKEGLFIELSVAQNLIACSLKSLSSFGILSGSKVKRMTGEWIGRFSIKVSHLRQPVKTLSGGNQQKIALGRWLHNRAKVLMMIEPTRGIDINTKTEIYRLLRELAEQGYAVIVSTNELIELIGLCDRVAVMYEKEIVRTLQGDELTEQAVISASFGQRGSGGRQS